MQDHYCKLHKKFQNRWILIAPPYQNRTFCECCKFQLDKGEELFITIEEFQEKYINPLKDRIKDQKQSENVDKLCKIFKTLLCEIEKILIQMNNIKINFEEIFEDIKKQQQEFENIINNHSFENPHQFSLKEIIQLKNSNKLNDLQDQKFSYFKSFNEVVNQLENIITGFKIQIDQQDQIVSKNFQEYKDQKKDEFKWVGKKKYIGQFWNKNIEIYQKFHFNLEFCLNNEIIYEEFDGTTLRQEQIYDITKQPIILVNNEQIKNFQWVGEYEKVQKVGKWKAYWNGQIIPQIEGYYFEGMKNGFWKECSKNYCSQVNCFEQGFYCNEKRKGIWRYLYEDIEIGGGLYNDSNQKHGIWTELSDHFCSKVQIIYNGKFQNDNKTGIWVILFRDMINQPFKQMYDVNLIIYYCIFWNNPLVEADYIKFVLIKINNKTEMGQIIVFLKICRNLKDSKNFLTTLSLLIWTKNQNLPQKYIMIHHILYMKKLVQLRQENGQICGISLGRQHR
ncbi:unnamed protein product [Paramecium sonneborni]|uniref:Uncharacterized protein n=1 Tax=Paramecium sonneborni TaxID=65129 RepID=A0A8S1NN51_9CILI|nr:unnamed protein product [Paramecium sonneborni]